MSPDAPVLDAAATVAAIWDLLDTVVDPCHFLSGHDISILDLGFVNSVEIAGPEAQVSITLTEMSCTFGWRIMEQIQSLADEVDEVDAIVVRIAPFPAWTPDRMSERGRAVHDGKRRAYQRIEAARAAVGDRA